MSLIQKGLKTAPLLAKSMQVQPVRNLQSIPCRNKIPTPQMLAMGGCLVATWLATPIYILTHIKYYNGSVVKE